MAFGNSRSARFEDDPELAKFPVTNGDNGAKIKFHIDGTQIPEPSSNMAPKKVAGKFLKTRMLSRVFSEDYGRVKRIVLDPRGQTIHRWNKIFLVACLVSLFVDPLFFYLPVVRDEVCIDIGITLEVILTLVRSVVDVFYVIQILMKFRTAFVAPSSRVFGRGELVLGYYKIAFRYLRKGFWLDFVAALPLPQVLIWIVIPTLRGSTMANTKKCPSLFHHFPIYSEASFDFPTFITNC